MSKKNRDGRKLQLGKKLIAYSAAAGATLALAHPANAEIVYSGIQNIAVSPPMGDAVKLDMDGDNITDFEFRANSLTSDHFVWLDPLLINSALKEPAAPSYFNRLPAGYDIKEGPSNWTQNSGYLQRFKNSSMEVGNFIDQKGFIGVRFVVNSEKLNGWVQYQGTGYSNGTIIDWAYETNADRTILAGFTGILPNGGADIGTQAVPTLNQWGLMILAALILAGGARRARNLSSKSS